MSVSVNPLETTLGVLWQRLNILNGMLDILQKQLNNYRTMLKENLNKNNFPTERVVAGASLVIRDLTEFPPNKWARYYPSGVYFTQGEEYISHVDRFIERESAFTIAQGHEIFETFVLDILAVYLEIHPHRADQKSLKKRTQELKKDGLDPSQLEFWKRYIRRTYKESFKAIEFIRQLISLAALEEANNRNLNLKVWLSVVAEIRHASVHSDMIILDTRINKSWGSQELNVLKTYFSGTQLSRGYKLNLTTKEAEQALIIIAEYGYGIFKNLSQTAGYPCTILLWSEKQISI